MTHLSCPHVKGANGGHIAKGSAVAEEDVQFAAKVEGGAGELAAS